MSVLDVNKPKKLTYRLGKYELNILKSIFYNPYENYNQIRKHLGVDPNELLNAYSKYFNESGINPIIKDSRKRHIKKINHKYQVSFNRAIKRLIEKELIYRHWTIVFDTPIDPDELSNDGAVFRSLTGEYEGFSELDFYYGAPNSRKDLPSLKVVACKPAYNLTRTGEIELERRGIKKEEDPQ